MVDRGQDDPPLHPLDGQCIFDGRRGPQGMADLGFVGRDGNLLQMLPEDRPQAVDLGLIPFRRGGAVGIDVLDIFRRKPRIVDRLPDPPDDRFGGWAW